MSRRLTVDITASVMGRGMAAGAVFLFTPLYLRLLGPESFGLLGIYAVLLSMSLCLDQALSPLVTQRFSKIRAADSSTNLRGAFLSLEMLVLLIAGGVGMLVLALSPWLATDVLDASKLAPAELQTALAVMAGLLVLQWPSFFYAAALAGLGRQLSLNVTRTALTLVQWGGGYAALIMSEGSLLALLAWNGVSFLLLSISLRHTVLKALPNAGPATSWGTWRGSLQFSVGTLAIGVSGMLLTQVDKLLVAAFEPLATFTAYTLAFTASSIVSVFIAQPVVAVALPYFSRLVAMGNEAALHRAYHRWTQITVCAVVPLLGALVFNPADMMTLWLRSPSAEISKAAHYVPWIAAGTLVNVIMMLPLTLQLAHGWSTLSAWKNLVAVPVFIGVTWWGIRGWGPIAGACAWLFLNLGYYLIETPLMHRRLLTSSLWRWWIADTALPCAGGLAVYWVADSALTSADLQPLARCVIAGVTTCALIWLFTPAARDAIRSLHRQGHAAGQ